MREVEWPSSIPCEPLMHLWQESINAFVYGARLIGLDKIDTYVELGSWCGASAAVIAQMNPKCQLYCVDTWDGRGGDGQYPEDIARRSLRLFQANLWDWRDRVHMLQMTTSDGLIELHERGVQPDAIYIDADHHYDGVRKDIIDSTLMFPTAQICGDDWDEVAEAVVSVFGRMYGCVGHKFWWHVKYKWRFRTDG